MQGDFSMLLAPSSGSTVKVMWGEHAQEALGQKHHPQLKILRAEPACFVQQLKHICTVYMHPPTHPPQILQQQQFATVGQMAHTKVANCFQHYLFIRSMYVTQTGGFKSKAIRFLPCGCCVMTLLSFCAGWWLRCSSDRNIIWHHV